MMKDLWTEKLKQRARGEYFDETTASAIGWKSVWHRFEPLTPFGKELKAGLQPFLPGEEEALERELDVVLGADEAWRRNGAQFADITSILSGIRDLRGSVAKASAGGVLDTVELYEMKRFCMSVKELRDRLKESGWAYPKDVEPFDLEGLLDVLDPSGRRDRTFFIDEAFSEGLARIRLERRKKEKAYRERMAAIQEKVAADLGMSPNFRGEIPISKADEECLARARVHPNLAYVRESAGYTYFQVTEDAKARRIAEALEKLKEREYKEEARVRARLSRQVGVRSAVLLETMRRVGRLDFLLAKARMAYEMDAVKPVIARGGVLEVEEGRHPVIEDALRKKGKRFVPVSIALKNGVAVITGPNMGGKTVTLKTVGLLCAMAQFGFLVPAKSFRLSLRRYIYFSAIEDGQAVGLSSFGMEIAGLKSALRRRNESGLILLDELSRGTNPREGFALSAAVIRYLKDTNSITVFATHYDGLGAIEGVAHWQVRGLAGVNLAEAFERLSAKSPVDAGLDWLQEHMDYRLQQVSGDAETPKDALVVARLLGLDEEVLKAAERVLKSKKSCVEGVDTGGVRPAAN